MFIGRKEELDHLLSYLKSDRQENIVIYGRRRIGKSELIKEALRKLNKPFIFYQAKETTLKDNINSLSTIVTEHFNLKELLFNSLEDILRFLFKRKEEIIFVIDEYPYLMAIEKGLNSIVQSIIDEYKHTSKVKLVLLGSYIGIMAKLTEADSPLFGRIASTMFIREMNYQETSLFYPNEDLETKVKYYSLFGGVPYYNSLIDENKTFEENVFDLIIKPNSPLGDFVEMILSKELRKLNNANAVFLAVASGKSKFNEILGAIGNSMSSAALSFVLNDLIRMDLIKKTIPINESESSRRTNYEVNDNYIDFYYRYIYRYSSSRSILAPQDFYKEMIEINFNEAFVPKKFEKLAAEYLVMENKKGAITPPLLEIGKYWYDNSKEKINGEFDLVARDKIGFIVYEAKYTNRPVNNTVVKKLKYQLEICKVDYYEIGLFSKTGFEVDDKGKYYLRSLEEMYDF